MKRGANDVKEYVWRHALLYMQDRDVELKRLRFMVKDLEREYVSHCYICLSDISPGHAELVGECQLCGQHTHCSKERCIPRTCSTCNIETCIDCIQKCTASTCDKHTCLQCSNCKVCYVCMFDGDPTNGGCITHPLSTRILQNGEEIAICDDCNQHWPNEDYGTDLESPKWIEQYRKVHGTYRERINARSL